MISASYSVEREVNAVSLIDVRADGAIGDVARQAIAWGWDRSRGPRTRLRKTELTR
jgi:hypothetical protein